MRLGADAPMLRVEPDEVPSPAPRVDAQRHWRVLPELDHRHGVPARDRGTLHPGHTRALPCAACAAPPAPATRPPPPPLGAARGPERETVRVRGDRALPPTLRPLPPPEARHAQRPPAPRSPTARPSRPCTPPPPATPLTSRQRILLALASLGDGPVTLAALAVRAWEQSPTTFGLRGCEATHPDSNRVWAKLSGTDGLGARGWCTRPAPGVVAITAEGRRIAASLAKGGAR